MKIWVDADACPVAIKKILFRAAERTSIELTLVSNHPQFIPERKNIAFQIVPQGMDVADNEIVKRVSPDDLVITADIPLAAEVVEKGCIVLSPRGELMTAENVRSRLSVRNFMDALRSGGIDTGGPAALNEADKRKFAGHLDKILRTRKK